MFIGLFEICSAGLNIDYIITIVNASMSIICSHITADELKLFNFLTFQIAMPKS